LAFKQLLIVLSKSWENNEKRIFMSSKKHQIVIIGAGTAGITVAAQLQLKHAKRKLDIAIIDPSEKHYYQPLWTMVGGGIYTKEETARNTVDYIPNNVTWIRKLASSFQADENCLILNDDSKIYYEILIIAPGIQVNWHKIQGLQEALGKNGVCSNYDYRYTDYTWECVQKINQGRAIFTQPPLPIKCAGAPQKAMYLSEDYFRRQAKRDQIEVMYCNAGERVFGVEKYKKSLEKVITRKGIVTNYQHNLVAINGEKQVATFQKADGQHVDINFDMIHVVPPQSAPDFITSSNLCDKDGWVDVDKFTMQHVRYPNIFSLGDASSLPTSRTGAAIRKEAPVLVQNLIDFMDGKTLSARYDGYTSCPIVTGYGSLILAEFDYDGKPVESFPFDQSQERYSMYLLKKHILPRLYWHGMLRGRA
jgi:sulfide:quinone oxidoreductase